MFDMNNHTLILINVNMFLGYTAAMTGNDQVLCCGSITEAVISDDDALELAAILKALSDPARLKLVSYIACNGEACACDFGDVIDKSQPTISHHLSQLVNANILEREQRGKWAWFTVNPDRLATLRTALG